jgi:acetylornithine deacetylase/succinyl-diaminopimelate desuccinylase-like protein
VGMIEGGASVNSIPEHARARFDLRSTDAAQLLRMEVHLHRAVEDAVTAANAAAQAQGVHEHPLIFTIAAIGHRPAGALREDARILDLLRAVDRHLNLRTECRTASTDANIPLSLGVEAISIGAGGDGGGIHTRGEWYDARGRSLGLRRVLLLLLALAMRFEVAVAAD